MKLMNMKKKLLAISIITVAISSAAFAEQQVTQDLGTFGKWKSAKIRDHALFHKDACLAYTLAAEKGGSTLEVFSAVLENAQGEIYVEPTIQVIARGVPAFVRGTLEDENGKNITHLTLATNAEGAFGLLAREADRKNLVALIRKASSATVKLVNEKGKVVKKLTFSLSGSTKGTDAIVKACDVKFE